MNVVSSRALKRSIATKPENSGIKKPTQTAMLIQERNDSLDAPLRIDVELVAVTDN
jgi:hypothetical protein